VHKSVDVIELESPIPGNYNYIAQKQILSRFLLSNDVFSEVNAVRDMSLKKYYLFKRKNMLTAEDIDPDILGILKAEFIKEAETFTPLSYEFIKRYSMEMKMHNYADKIKQMEAEYAKNKIKVEKLLKRGKLAPELKPIKYNS